MSPKTSWFIKGRRAQSVDDYETWNEGGVSPTLNAMDNTGDTRATVLIFYGNRVDDIRIQGDVINTLQARMGTGGGNMPIVAYPIDDGREVEKHQNGTGIGEANAPAYTLDTRQHASVATSQTVRRLTPMECERLQGFEDDWTKWDENGKEVTDGHRYKQMGNAVAVPVVEWIVKRLLHPSL